MKSARVIWQRGVDRSFWPLGLPAHPQLLATLPRNGPACPKMIRMALRDLSVRTTGPDVKAIQQGLNIRRGSKPKLKEDGLFGKVTDYAVRDFQGQNLLSTDGIVGPKTRRSLFPLGAFTATVVGRRSDLKPTSLWPRQQPTGPKLSSVKSAKLLAQELQLPAFDDLDNSVRRRLLNPKIQPRYIWPLSLPVPMPVIVDPSLTLLGFNYDHDEAVANAQTTFNLGSQRQDMIVFGVQSVYVRGSKDGANQQLTLGATAGRPLSAGEWVFNPFIQFTDVDRFGALGNFHWWQPYAQVGFQFSAPGDPQPAFTANLFPINLGLDIGKDFLTLGLGAGMSCTVG
jgi:Putative peptidoglycan binding domain